MLSGIYEEWRTKAASEVSSLGEQFFPPILVRQPDEWENSLHRVAFIGQETMGWSWTRQHTTEYGYSWPYDDMNTLSDFIDQDTGVQALMHGYEQFEFARRQPKNFNSPFWRYFRQVRDRLAADGSSVSIIFSNLIRCAANTDDGFTLWSMPEEQRFLFLNWQHGLLKRELSALNPTLIIFVTGPYYDEYMRSEFDDLVFDALADHSPRLISKLRSPDLIAPAYRTYHPGYLNRNFSFVPLQAAISDAFNT